MLHQITHEKNHTASIDILVDAPSPPLPLSKYSHNEISMGTINVRWSPPYTRDPPSNIIEFKYMSDVHHDASDFATSAARAPAYDLSPQQKTLAHTSWASVRHRSLHGI